MIQNAKSKLRHCSKLILSVCIMQIIINRYSWAMVISKKVLEVTKIFLNMVLIVTNDFTSYVMVSIPKVSQDILLKDFSLCICIMYTVIDKHFLAQWYILNMTKIILLTWSHIEEWFYQTQYDSTDQKKVKTCNFSSLPVTMIKIGTLCQAAMI